MAASVKPVVDVQFRATGVAAVQSGFQAIRAGAQQTSTGVSGMVGMGDALGYRFGIGAQRAAGALSMIAAAGEAGQRQMRSLLQAGAEMAFSFGVGGPIVGAFALGGLAIYNYFERIRNEIIATRKTALEEIQKIAEGGNLADAGKAQQYNFSGNPSALKMPDETNAAFIARRYGIQGVRGKIEELRPQIPADLLKGLGNGMRSFGGLAAPGVNDKANFMGQLLDQLARLKQAQADLAPVTAELTQREAARAKANVQLLQSEKTPAELDRRTAMLLEQAKAGSYTTAGTGLTGLGQAKALIAALNEELTHPQDDARVAQIKKELDELSRLPGVMSNHYGLIPMQVGNLPAAGAYQSPGLVIQRALRSGQMGSGVTAAVASTLNPSSTPDQPIDIGKGPQIGNIGQAMQGTMAQAQEDLIEQFGKEVQEPLNAALQRGMADTIGGSISAGISAGFRSHSISGALTAGGQAILAGIGSMIEQEGEVWIRYGVIKTSLMAALANPFGSGPAAIAAGALMVATGAAISSIWSGGRGGGPASGTYAAVATSNSAPFVVSGGSGAIGASSTHIAATSITPKSNITLNATIIGKDDPTAQRQLQEMLARADRRGSTIG